MNIPHKVATLALLVRDGTVLLGLKVRKGADIGEGTVNGPGGKVEGNQTLEENLIQEVKDEVGITIPTNALTDTKCAVITFHNGSASVWEVHVYQVTSFSGEPTNSAEMVCPEGGWWHAFNTLPLERMLPADAVWLPKALSGERFNAHIYLTDTGEVDTENTEFTNW